LIRFLIDLYILILVVDVILSYLPQLREKDFALKIKKIADATCGPIRKHLMKDAPFDFSAIVVIFILNLLKVLW